MAPSIASLSVNGNHPVCGIPDVAPPAIRAIRITCYHPIRAKRSVRKKSRNAVASGTVIVSKPLRVTSSTRPHTGATMTEITTAREMQHQYVVELRKQMGVLLLIFGVVSFSVVVLVFCIFYMIVKLKQRDVAIMKSCGAASASVAWIFVGFGVTVGMTGAGIGAVFGYVITKNINIVEEWIRIVFGQKLWSSSVYMFDKIPNEVDWGSALPIVGLAIAAAAFGALMPAVMAARTRPVEVLRYE